MVTIPFVFWMCIFLFATVGALRGWAKELLVTFSVILALFVITVLQTYVGFVRDFIEQMGPVPEFWTQTTILILLTIFGYQTPNIPRLAVVAVREKLQDSLLGVVLGGFNGYLIIGSLWAFLDKVGYPFQFVTPPTVENVGESAMRLLGYLPPIWLQAPEVYFAVAIAFTFVVIVYI